MKFWYNPNSLALLFIIILSIPALKSLAINGFYTSHDGETHAARIAQYFIAIKDGQLPPRLAGSFYNGLGSPIFVYIYPLPYALGAAVHFLGFSYADSFKILMALSFIASGIFSYLWLKEIIGSEKAAFLGAIFFTWVPYRFSLIYVRASLSEMFAYTFLPLLLYSGAKLAKNANFKWSAITATSAGALLLSQNLVAIISAPVIAIYFLILIIQKKSLKHFLLCTLSAIWALAIASITYGPSLIERKYIRLEEIIRVAYYDHFVTLWQLIRSPWDYGFDLPGTVNDRLSFQIGLAHLLVILLFFAFLLYQSIKGLFLFRKNEQELNKKTNVQMIFAIFFFLFILTSIILMLQTRQTVSIWQQFKVLQIIDIPWRLVGIVALSTSFLAAFLVKKVKFGALFLILIALVIIANRNHLRINKQVFFDDLHFENYTGTATQYDEFTPIWRQTTKVPVGFDPDLPIEIKSGNAIIKNVIAKSNQISADIEVSKIAQIQINKFYFPNWQIFDNDKLLSQKQVTITGVTNLDLASQRDESGLMSINLNHGLHQILVQYSETPVRIFVNWLSLISIVIAIAAIFKNVKFIKISPR